MGHKSPGSADNEPDRIFNDSRRHINDFKNVALKEKSAPAIVEEMKRLYPHFGNHNVECIQRLDPKSSF